MCVISECVCFCAGQCVYFMISLGVSVYNWNVCINPLMIGQFVAPLKRKREGE